MQDWMLPHITSYWDERVDAIERLSRLIETVPEAERAAELSALSAAVARQADALADTDIVKFAFPIVDDLYKAAAKRSYLDQPVFQYLEASCGPFFQALSARDYVVYYFIDNSFDRLDGPAIGFPLWFGAAKLFYICPQEIACHSFEKDKPAEEWPALVNKYIGDSREVGQQLVTRCRGAGRHFVYLDIDAHGSDFEFAHKTSEDPGAIFVFRQEAPVPGSHSAVGLPTAPRTARAPVEAKTSASEPSATLAPASAPVASPVKGSGGTAELKPLIDGLVGGNEDTRRTNRRALVAALAEALATADDLDSLKAVVDAFRNAGWTLIGQAEYGDGEYTLAAVINVLIHAIQCRPELKAWLPLVIDDRVKRFMQAPVADLNMAAYSELDNALDRASKHDTPT
jgi:hypothetical protein